MSELAGARLANFASSRQRRRRGDVAQFLNFMLSQRESILLLYAYIRGYTKCGHSEKLYVSSCIAVNSRCERDMQVESRTFRVFVNISVNILLPRDFKLYKQRRVKLMSFKVFNFHKHGY